MDTAVSAQSAAPSPSAQRPSGAAQREGTPEVRADVSAPSPHQLISPEGERMRDADLDPWVEDIDDAHLLTRYEDMVVVRRIDVEATALQRQGQIGLWPPLLGQEAAQIGSARCLRDDDFVFTSYRENGVAYCRGIGTAELISVWRGVGASGWDPYEYGMASPAVIIGAQTLHATGFAMGCAKDGSDAVAVAYFGDGATSQGDTNEAMVFARSFGAPVVFFCQNNQWAISEPVGLQSVGPIAARAPGFGIPSLRVDGNDVLAVMAATRWAIERARSGNGPSYIEAVTYRMGPHTTSDDPSRYLEPGERDAWALKDPVLRLERLLTASGALTEERRAEVASRADAVAAELRSNCIGMADPPPLSVFDHVYTEPTSWLRRQRSQYVAYLDQFEEQDAGVVAEAGEGAGS